MFIKERQEIDYEKNTHVKFLHKVQNIKYSKEESELSKLTVISDIHTDRHTDRRTDGQKNRRMDKAIGIGHKYICIIIYFSPRKQEDT